MNAVPGAPPRWPWAAVLAAYFGLTCAGHLRFSVWLVSKRDSAFGPYSFQQAVPVVAAAGLLCLAILTVRDVSRSGGRSRRTAAWALWWLAMGLVDRHLTYSLNEIAHTPQYAWIAWLLARTLDPGRERWIPGRTLFLAVLLGALDEALQYLWIAADYGDYFDFNDVLADLVGAALGLMLYYPADGTPSRRPAPATGSLAVAAVVLAWVAGASATGLLQVDPPGPVPPGGIVWQADGEPRLYLQREAGAYGSERKGFRRPTYRVLTPSEGLLICVLAGAVFARLIGAPRRAGMAGGRPFPEPPQAGRCPAADGPREGRQPPDAAL